MKKLITAFAALLLTVSAWAQTKDVVDVAIGSADHTTLVTAVKAADLVKTLKGKGPFTVFAPTNAAFAKLPEGTLNNLLKPENKAQLAKILTYHVVSGNLDAAAVKAAVEAGKGKAEVTTVSGGKLKVTIEGGKVKLTDEGGKSAFVSTADFPPSSEVGS